MSRRGLFAAVLLLPRLCGPAACEVSDAEARRAYDQIQSAFIDLDRAVPPPSPAEIGLGRQLFFDPRLSGNRAMSCATCHNPGLAWADGLKRARGLHQDELARNTPSLFNVNRNIPFLYFWDGRADTLEQAATTALRSRLEMNRAPEALIAELNRIPAYVRAFYDVYGYPGLTESNVIRAIAAFIRAEIRAEPTPFDRFDKEPSALGQAERRGMQVFTGRGRCMQCHNGPFFSDDFFHNVGLKATPGLTDLGRYEVTRLRANRRAFRTPPLRNVARTAPYMHDGSLATLRDVIEFYSRGGDEPEDRDPEIRRLDLSESEKSDLLAFLRSLSSPPQTVTHPVLPPSGPPDTLEDAVALQRLRLELLDGALRRGERALAAAVAGALREDAADRAPLLAVDGAAPPPCLEAMRSNAARLAALAQSSGAARDLEQSAGALKRAAADCARPPEGRPGTRAPAPAVEVATGAAAGCARPPTVAEVAAALARGNLPPARLAELKGAVMGDLLKVHRFRAILAKDPAACDGLRGLRDEYRGVVREADRQCREWYRNDALHRAIVTRAPDLEARCIDYLGQPHDNTVLEPAQAEEACAILSSGIDDPKAACARLVPRYLGEMKAGTCENLLRRLTPGAEDSACDPMKALPGDQWQRCLDLAAFGRAWRSRDPELCGEREFCRAFMGDRAGSEGRAEARLRAASCGSLDAPATAPEPGCLPGFTVGGFVRDVAGGKYAGRTDRLKESTVRDVLFYYEFTALLERSPARCGELKGFEKTYAGVVRPADEVCRERYYEDRLQSGLIARSPELEADCRESLLHSYDYVHMGRDDAASACAILTANVDDPKAACAKLVPRYLGEMKLASCENIILRLKPGQDAAICSNLENQPRDWMGRCLGLSAFNNAFWKKDLGLCGEDGLCRALMGDAAGSAGVAAARVHTLACNALRARD